jgi:hypothetical protein
MKAKRLLLLLAALAHASCTAPAEWLDGPNPMDTPAGHSRPVGSHGHFGPNWEQRRAFGG